MCTLYFYHLRDFNYQSKFYTVYFFGLRILTQESFCMVFRFASGLCKRLFEFPEENSFMGCPIWKNFPTSEGTCKTGVHITAILNIIPVPKDRAGCFPILCVTSFFFPLLRFEKLVATFSDSYTTDLFYRHLKNACYRGNICSGFRRLTNHFPKILVAVRTCSVNFN